MSEKEKKFLVLKFGGSKTTTTEGVNKDYVASFLSFLGISLLKQYERLGLVVGGGTRIRELQKTVKTEHEKDMVAREALLEHAKQLRDIAKDLSFELVDDVPNSAEEALCLMENQRDRQVLIASWLQEGQSTDASAAFLASEWRNQGFKGLIVFLSNVASIFTKDPKRNSDAEAIRTSSLECLIKEGVLMDDPAKFSAGMNVVIDPVAVSRIQNNGEDIPDVFFADASDSKSVKSFIQAEEHKRGTHLSPRFKKTTLYDK